MAKVGACELLGLILCLAGVTLAAVAHATDRWTDTSTAYSGLWKVCQIDSGVTTCSSLGFSFSGTQLFITIVKIAHLAGLGLCGIALLIGSCGLCKEDSRNGNVAAQGGIYITAGVVIGLASGLYILVGNITSLLTSLFTTGAVSVTVTISSWGYSYWLSWVSFATLFIGGIWLCCASCQMKKHSATVIPVALPPQPQQAQVQVTTTQAYY